MSPIKKKYIYITYIMYYATLNFKNEIYVLNIIWNISFFIVEIKEKKITYNKGDVKERKNDYEVNLEVKEDRVWYYFLLLIKIEIILFYSVILINLSFIKYSWMIL